MKYQYLTVFTSTLGTINLTTIHPITCLSRLFYPEYIIKIYLIKTEQEGFFERQILSSLED